MRTETFYEIAQVIRTLLPVFAAIGTVSSAVGFWRIFSKWNVPGILSLVPFARGWVFGKDSPHTARGLYAFSDGMIVVLTPIFYYIRAYGKLSEYRIGGFVFYVDRAMLIVTAIWAVCEVVRFLSSVHIAANLCKKNNRGKGWVVSWVLLPKISKILWGFSDRFMTDTGKDRGKQDGSLSVKEERL